MSGLDALSDRERDVLRRVVQRFIDTAAPVGSKALSDDIDLSSASVRNTMSRLEQAGYLDHPHTSAGRIPTVRGYRTYVDDLMDVSGLTQREAGLLRDGVRRRLGDINAVAQESSRLIGRLAQLLGVVLTPKLATSILDRIEIIPLSSSRILFVLALRSGLARTLQAEVDAPIAPGHLDAVVQRLNERLSGLTLSEVRRTGAERVQDLAPEDQTGIVRVVLREAPALFEEPESNRRAAIAGAGHLVTQPEFAQPDVVRDVIELAENADVVVHLLERPARVDPDDPHRAVVLIGREVDPEAEPDSGPQVSVVTAPYHVGNAAGAVAVIGPTRMNYARAVALVEYVAALLDRSTDSPISSRF